MLKYLGDRWRFCKHKADIFYVISISVINILQPWSKKIQSIKNNQPTFQASSRDLPSLYQRNPSVTPPPSQRRCHSCILPNSLHQVEAGYPACSSNPWPVNPSPWNRISDEEESQKLVLTISKILVEKIVIIIFILQKNVNNRMFCHDTDRFMDPVGAFNPISDGVSDQRLLPGGL